MTGRLLIVDDVATNRIVLRSRLAESLHETLLAADGLSALHSIRDHRPDLVLLDLDLPDIPGTEVLARLRADPATRDLPVIIVTARIGDAARAAAFAAAEQHLLATGALAPIYFNTKVWLMSPRVRGWQEDGLWSRSWHSLSLDEK